MGKLLYISTFCLEMFENIPFKILNLVYFFQHFHLNISMKWIYVSKHHSDITIENNLNNGMRRVNTTIFSNTLFHWEP